MSKEELRTTDMVIDAFREAYIQVMGVEKWQRLTDEEKHEATMICVKDMLKALS